MSNEMISFPRELSDDLAEFIAEKARVFGQPAAHPQGKPVESPAPVPATPVFAQTVLAKLGRFQECAFDGQDSDIGREWFDVLVQLGLLSRVQRSPALWEITDEGIAALEDHAAQPDAEIPASLFCLPRFDMDQTACEIPDPDGVWVRYDDVAAFLQHQGSPVVWLDPTSGRKANTISNALKRYNESKGGAPAAAAALYTVPLYARLAIVKG